MKMPRLILFSNVTSLMNILQVEVVVHILKQ